MTLVLVHRPGAGAGLSRGSAVEAVHLVDHTFLNSEAQLLGVNREREQVVWGNEGNPEDRVPWGKPSSHSLSFPRCANEAVDWG